MTTHTCDLCGQDCGDEYSDARLHMVVENPEGRIRVPWATLCKICAQLTRVRYGMGHGQRYQRDDQGSWAKVEG